MKRHLFYLLIFLPILHFSQIRTRLSFNDLEIMNLKGEVKEIKERTFEVNKNKLTFDNGLLIPVNFNYFFDESGYVKYKEGIKKIDNKEIISTQQYFKFDKNKIIVDLYLITEFTDIDSIMHKYTYPNDSIIFNVNTSGSYRGLTEKTFRKENLDLTELYHPGEKVLETKKIKYNIDNKIISIEKDGFDGKESIERTYAGNSKCNDFKTEIVISLKYKINSTEIREYDKFCNVIKKSFQSDNFKTNDLKFEYIYDNRGNWIERKSFNFGGKIYSITKRTLTYY